MSLPSYSQETKRLARRMLLTRAVTGLTAERRKSAVVRIAEFDQILSCAMDVLEGVRPEPEWRRAVDGHADSWRALQASFVGERRAQDLRVLYLCGPEPQNDLDVLLGLGVAPHNIWAVESGTAEYRAAIKELERGPVFVRVHHGTLEQFFERVNERFDLIYFDGCGPLPGGRPNTLRPLVQVIHRERLAPLGALVTTFAEPPEEKRADYSELLALFFGARYNDFPRALWDAGLDPVLAPNRPEYLMPAIEKAFDDIYSDFISRFIVEMARDIVPPCRVVDIPDVRRKYFVEAPRVEESVKRAVSVAPIPEGLEPKEQIAAIFANAGDVIRSPLGYPMWTFVNAASKRNATRPLMDGLFKYKLTTTTIEEALPQAVLLANIYDSDSKVASEEMFTALRASWFDYKGRFFCDVPLPNLLINSLIGIYGHPYFSNPRSSQRLAYTAKSTRMFGDCTILDQCRYFFDYLPSIDLVPARFRDHAYQLVLRVCLDLIGRHDWASSSHPFRGAALVGFDECPAAQAHELTPRADLGGP